MLINTLKRLISTSRQIAVSQRLTVIDLQSLTYGQLATFKVNTENSSISFIQCFLRFLWLFAEGMGFFALYAQFIRGLCAFVRGC